MFRPNKFIKSLAFIVSVLAISLSLGYLVSAWTEPTVAPPTGNVSAPLNVSSIGQSKAGGLILNTGGAPNGLIIQSGNVGIGTTGPGSLLHILGTGHTYLTIGSSGVNTNDRGIQFNNQTGAVAGYILVVPNTVGTDSEMKFFVGGDALSDQKMVINDAGNVGIGTTNISPGVKLEVAGGNLKVGAVTIKGDGSESTGLNTEKVGGYTAADLLAAGGNRPAYISPCVFQGGPTCQAAGYQCPPGWSAVSNSAYCISTWSGAYTPNYVSESCWVCQNTFGLPAQVTGLTATPGNTQAVLNWTAPNNGGSAITSYKVYRGTTSSGETLLASGGCSGLGNVLTCTDTGLTNGTTYYYKVSAVNVFGSGSQSAEVSANPHLVDGYTFKYKRSITLSPVTSTANYQVQVTLTTANFNYTSLSYPATGQDIRFTGSDGTTVQNYWIESWNNGGTSSIWVNVTASGASSIYMYYGSASASSASNAMNTFPLFDDFETYTLGSLINGQNGWVATADVRMAVQNDYASHGSQSLRGYGTLPYASKSFDKVNSDVLVQYDIQTNKDTASTYDWVSYNLYDDAKNVQISGFGRQYDGYGNQIISSYDGTNNPLMAYSVNSWYNVKIWLKMNTKKQDIWINDVKIKTDVNWYDMTATGINKIYFQTYGPSSMYSWVDRIRVRKYALPEPVATVGAEQSL